LKSLLKPHFRAKKSNISYKSEDKFPDDDEVEKLMIHVG